MSARRRTIGDLIKTTHVDRRPLAARVGKVKFDRYRADLVEVVKAERDGAALPSTEELAEYFRKELGIVVAPSTIREHLRGIRKGNA